MSQLNVKAYRALFAGGMKLRAAIGGTLARFFIAMCTLAFLSMYTQAGYSYAMAGAGIAVVQCSNFLLAPRISRLVDRYGQTRIVPVAGAIGMSALAAVLLIVHFGGPIWLAFAVSALIGLTPQVQSLTRARWSYLFRKGGSYSPGLLKTAYSFEGILDDIAFMVAPAAAIAFSAWFFPEAGLVIGACAYVVGIALMLSDRASEPDVAYMRSLGADGEQAEPDAGQRSVLLAFPQVTVMFTGTFLIGLLFGFLDPATYGFCREVATEETASLVFMVSSIASVACGLVFGMVYMRTSTLRQILGAGAAVGILYLPMAFVGNIPLLFAAHIIGAFSYAPFIITLNSAVEKTVASSRVTECLTWLNAAMQLGLAAGPLVSGAIIDTLGTHAAFVGCSISGLCIPVAFVLCTPILRKHTSPARRGRASM